MLTLDFPVARLRGAAYNPRKISDDAEEKLDHSISLLGFVKPVICLPDGLIIAGHQRTKAARRLGLETVPAYVLQRVSEDDEVKFNQLHNGTDLDDVGDLVTIPPGTEAGFFDVSPELITGDLKMAGTRLRNEISTLILKYGPWGGAVATHSGVVISSGQYALACKSLGIPCRVHRVPDALGDEASQIFRTRFGAFNYDHIKRTPWVQSFAQPFRLRGDDDRGSQTYRHALKEIRKGDRILDFGYGQGDYLKKLRADGHRIYGVEFFARNAAWQLDVATIHRRIDEMCKAIRQDGLFDVIVCDSVINSVDSQQAEDDVLTCLSALARPGGLVFFSGRGLDPKLSDVDFTQSSWGRQVIPFCDEHGLTAVHQNGTGATAKGGWYFQKYHDRETVERIARRFLDPDPLVHWVRIGAFASWQVRAVRTVELPEEQIEASLRREFDLPWPGGRSVGRADQAVEAWRIARGRTK